MVIELPENKAFLHAFRAGSGRTILLPRAPDEAGPAAVNAHYSGGIAI